ncbi:coth protein-domain-containing protein, partial [Mycotypha africana]|uniref:coth protein-domain-containing protein n=1 Tax=Mycotypha africana TaxID=64632 RepID=UPI002301C4A1
MVSFKAFLFIPTVFAFAAFVNAQSSDANIHLIQYNVVKLLNETDRMAVMVDNNTYPLSRSTETPIIHTGQAPVAKSGYHYVKLDQYNNTQAESFSRSPVTIDTVYEYFNRTWNNRTLAQIPQLYAPLGAIHKVESDLHKDGQIATIYITANQTELDNMHHNSNADLTVNSSITYVSLNDVEKFSNVELSLSGRSSRWMRKLSYNLKLDKKDRLYHFRRLKLRALDSDPSYIREQLAYDIIKKTGLVSSDFSFIRVLMNNQELGLFGIIEAFQNPWLATAFANGDENYKNGNLYQGVFSSANASTVKLVSDLSYYENVDHYGLGQYKIKAKHAKKKQRNYKALQDFCKFVAETGVPTPPSDANVTNANTTASAPIQNITQNIQMLVSNAPVVEETDEVKEWKKHLDTDSFLRSMALEVILGYSDGYLALADNFYVYQNPKTNTMFYIPSDLDMTFGSGLFKLDDVWSGNYSTYPGINIRPVMTKILAVPQFKQQFEAYLKDLAEKLVNPAALNDRINDLASMIQEDVEWDKTCPRVGSMDLSQIVQAAGDSSMTNNPGLSAIVDQVGTNIPNLDEATSNDFGARYNQTIDFMTAVNGPTGHISLAGVKEFVQKSSENTLNFYNNKNSNNSSTAPARA